MKLSSGEISLVHFSAMVCLLTVCCVWLLSVCRHDELLAMGGLYADMWFQTAAKPRVRGLYRWTTAGATAEWLKLMEQTMKSIRKMVKELQSSAQTQGTRLHRSNKLRRVIQSLSTSEYVEGLVHPKMKIVLLYSLPSCCSKLVSLFLLCKIKADTVWILNVVCTKTLRHFLKYLLLCPTKKVIQK